MNIYYIIGAVAIILILLFVYWYSHRSNKEPHEYILVVSFDDGYYYDLFEVERGNNYGDWFNRISIYFYVWS